MEATIRTSEQVNDLFAALVSFQGEMEAVKKGQANPFYKSKYADLASINEAIKPHMAKAELAYLQSVTQSNGTGHVLVTTRIVHKTGQWYEIDLPIAVQKQDPQGYGSTVTYGRRYALQAALGLSAEDDDANAGVNPPQNYKLKKEPTAADIAYMDECANAINAITTSEAVTKYITDNAKTITASYFVDTIKQHARKRYTELVKQEKAADKSTQEAA